MNIILSVFQLLPKDKNWQNTWTEKKKHYFVRYKQEIYEPLLVQFIFKV